MNEVNNQNITGTALIAAERQRQVDVEGWTAEHDDKHATDGSLATAAACYAGYAGFETWGPPKEWPWDAKYWKPGIPIRMLVKAGALIAAEIDRRLRAGEAI